MIRTLALVLLACLACAAERIPADCRWIVQLDVQALFKSQTGEWIAAQLVKQPHAARLKLLESISGLQPRRDLRTVTICGVGADDDSGLVYARGTFDGPRLVTLAQAAEGYAAVPAGSHTIHTWIDKGKPAAGCLVQRDLLILGKTADRLREAITALEASAVPVPVVSLPAGWADAAFAVCAADQLAALAAGKPESAMLRNVRSFAARLSEAGNELVLEARAGTTDDTAAQQLVDAGRGLAAIVQLQRPGKLDAALFEALRTARLERDGSQASLRIALPIADAVRLIELKARGGKSDG
ncbi:MAG TPA: hypothetical protein DCS97_11520 [Planctomycetes bacterium]|nr:hypothetical protein [Planctomycetota bacterium]